MTDDLYKDGLLMPKHKERSHPEKLIVMSALHEPLTIPDFAANQ